VAFVFRQLKFIDKDPQCFVVRPLFVSRHIAKPMMQQFDIFKIKLPFRRAAFLETYLIFF
jgi:hypothetical protein